MFVNFSCFIISLSRGKCSNKCIQLKLPHRCNLKWFSLIAWEAVCLSFENRLLVVVSELVCVVHWLLAGFSAFHHSSPPFCLATLTRLFFYSPMSPLPLASETVIGYSAVTSQHLSLIPIVNNVVKPVISVAGALPHVCLELVNRWVMGWNISLGTRLLAIYFLASFYTSTKQNIFKQDSTHVCLSQSFM